MVVFSPSDVVQDFTFIVHRDGLYEAPEVLSLVLRRVFGETGVALGEDPGRVVILDSDGEWMWLLLMSGCGLYPKSLSEMLKAD